MQSLPAPRKPRPQSRWLPVRAFYAVRRPFAWVTAKTIRRVARPIAETLMQKRPVASVVNGINIWALENSGKATFIKGVIIAGAITVGIPVDLILSVVALATPVPEMTIATAIGVTGLSVIFEMNDISRNQIGVIRGEVVPDDEVEPARRRPALEQGRGRGLTRSPVVDEAWKGFRPDTELLPKGRSVLREAMVIETRRDNIVLPAGTDIDVLSGAGAHRDRRGNTRPESIYWEGRVLAYPPEGRGSNQRPLVFDNHFWMTPADVWERKQQVQRPELTDEISLTSEQQILGDLGPFFDPR